MLLFPVSETWPAVTKLRAATRHWIAVRCSHRLDDAKGFVSAVDNGKPFEEIPGPKALPGIGNLWRYWTGEYSMDRLHRTGKKKYDQFGPIVREEIIAGVNLLLLFRPEDIEQMYRVEGKYPSRRSHIAIHFYRLSKPEMYNNGGLLPTNGPEWYRIRMSLQRPISSPVNVRVYLPAIDEISIQFADFVAHCNRTNTLSGDFLDELSRVFAEFLGLVTFDTRFGSLESNVNSQSIPMKLIEAAATINRLVLSTDNGLQLWKKFKTPSYRKICEAQQYLEEISTKYINAKQLQMEQDQCEGRESVKTLLQVYLSSKELDSKDVLTMISDMLLAGVDTSSYTMSFVLYHLAKNAPKQEKLWREIQSCLPNEDDRITWETLTNMSYLKAVIKESMRLNPISIGVGRILPEDSVIAGYLIPKDTTIVSQNQVSSNLECYFHRASEFIPERWIKGDDEYRKVHPYLVLPFGHGSRSCIARRLAEQNLYVLLIRIIQRFTISWNGPDLDCISVPVNRPDKSLNFTFTDRKLNK